MSSGDISPGKKFWANSDLLPILIIIVWAVIQMYPFTLGGKAMMPDTWKSIHPWARGIDLEENQTNIFDTVLEYNTWYQYSQESLREGRVPHWNPWQFSGAPLYANRLIPYFFPPFIIAELIASPHRIVGMFQLFNLILSGMGMYFLFKRWKLRKEVSVASAVLWMTSGAHFLPFPPQLLGAIGFPWLLWALEGFIEKPSAKYIGIAGFILGMILMTGYPITIIHFSYFIVIYFIGRWIMRRRTGEGRLHWTIPLLVLVAVYVIGFGVSAISTVPTINYSQETVRKIAGFTDRASEPDIRLLITSPEEIGHDPILERFGDRTDTLLPINGRGTAHAWKYGGIIVYFLGLIGIFSLRPRAILLAIPGLLFAILIWQPEIQIALLDFLPGWRVSIIPPIQVLNLIMYLLAAIGLDSFLGEKYSLKTPAKILTIIFAGFCIWFTYRFLKVAPVINLPILNEAADPNLLAYSGFHRFYLVAFIFLSLLITIGIFVSRKFKLLMWGTTVGVLVFSLTTFWYLQPVYSEKNYTPETPFTVWVDENMTVDISEAGGGNRVARWALLDTPFNPDKKQKSPFIPNLHIPYRLLDVGGYDSLVPRRFIEYCTLFEDSFMSYRALMAFEAPSTMYHPAFRKMGIRWIISLGELPDESQEGCTLRWDDRYDGDQDGTDDMKDFIQVWEVDEPEPRAFLTRRIAYASDADDSPLVQSANWAARRINVVVVENPEQENRTPAFPEDFETEDEIEFSIGDIEFTHDDPEYLSIDVNAPEDCYLVLRDGWFPEWEAWLDGAETEIYPADYAFRAVFVPAGEHTIEFRYVPRSFYLGIWISVCTLAIIFLLVFPYIPGINHFWPLRIDLQVSG